MTIEQIQAQIRALPDDEYIDLRVWMGSEERARREAQPAIEQAQADLVSELQDAGKLEKPEAVTLEEAIAAPDKVPAWENPLTDHSKMYAKTDVITHNGHFWESTHAGLNSWEPGAQGVDEYIWRDVTERVRPTAPEENTASPGAIPFAPGLPVKEGDLVEYEGVVYKVLSTHTTQSYWPPSESPSLFERV
ncbi:carbohydrate-binding protein [Corynebacterium striatum]|uniref:carbohydrate-binding protein n=1 Tax=Corynebacterium striatum TaxID=43770 RepID=UPI0014191890|nr:carbohydrate-binding protein [Corynebacterium striatum]NHX52961.1 hypothetical protein [Corynebacterium striatum]NHY37573.1 hypothetical protein [Corynebacterium striatum]HAT1133772.1 hypothetical protein [Corynebacterium striatum]HAT1146103.1 hypothetical protein [Corynebacterium striatum]HAT1158831.1 hypothetical protein [Corynebacterium striatum]